MRNGIGKGVPRAAAVAAVLLGLAWSGVQGASGEMAPLNPEFAKWRAEQERREKESGGAVGRRGARDLEDGDYGLAPTVMDMSYLANLNQGAMQALTGDELPSKFDLREKILVTGVKDQGGYGTCWAFASLGALESAALTEGAGEWDLSENHLANLHGYDWDFSYGGNGDLAQAYLLRWEGPVEETSDPYPNPGGSSAGDAVLRVNRVRWFAGKRNPLDHEKVLAAVAEGGAVTVSYKHYKKGCYREDTHAYYNPWNATSDHMVCLVGWDDDYPKENFGPTYVPPGNGAYLVRNSWGEGWGDGGYFWVSYYDATFLTQVSYQFMGAEKPGRYGKVYQYDPLGKVNSFGAGRATEWGAAVFTAAEDEEIGAVGFYAMTPNTAYEVEVRRGVTAGTPRSGRLAATQAGRVDDAGFVIVSLDQTMETKAGELFSVVVKLTTPGYTYPLAVEYAVPGYSEKASALPGQTFVSANGTAWRDMTEVLDQTASCCVKAYVLGSSGGAVTVLAGIDCYSPDNSAIVASGRSKAFACRARYTDGRQAEVRPTWSVASGGEWGSIDEDGIFVAAEVEEEQTAVVRAEYTEGGVTATAEFTVTIVAEVPAAPDGLEATAGTDTGCVRLNWKPVTRATTYAVYRAVGAGAGSDQGKYLGEATATTYADTQAVPGMDYTYYVKAKNGAGSGVFSGGAEGWRALSAPPDVTATDGTVEGAVRVTWGAVEGAGAYQVLRDVAGGEEPAALTGWIAELSWRDETAEPGTVYLYSVRAAVDSEGTRAGESSAPDSGLAPKPIVPESLEILGPTSLDSGATGFYTAVATYSDGNSNEVEADWTAEGASATTYTFVWRAPEGMDMLLTSIGARYSEKGVTVEAQLTVSVQPPLPGGAEAPRVIAADAGGVRLEWDAVTNALGHTLWRGTREDASDAADLGLMDGCAWTDRTGIPGEPVYYFVQGVNPRGAGPMSPASAMTWRQMGVPEGVSATLNVHKDKVAVSWRGVAGRAPYYRVWRAEGAETNGTAIGGWQAGTAFDDETAEEGVEYRYAVQAAADATGARPGALSAWVPGSRKAVVRPVSLEVIGPERVEVDAGGTAQYAARVTFSDGSISTAEAVWALDGGSDWATISATGALVLGNIDADRTATVRAEYTDEGTTVKGEKTVALVASRTAKVAVSSVTAQSRWPWAGIIDIDYMMTASPAGTLADITVEAWDHDLDAAIVPRTLTGDGADGPIGAGKHRISWDIGADLPNYSTTGMDIDVKAGVHEENEPEEEPGKRKFALCVGINKYSSTYISGAELSGCVNDATYFCSNLVERGGWRATNAVLLTDAKAKKNAIRTAISNAAAQAVAGDTFVYLQSSHGESKVLCTYNANYSADELAADLGTFASGVKVVVLLDTENAATVIRSKAADAGGTDLPGRVSAALEARRSARGEGKISAQEIGWVVSCGAGEYSWDGGYYDSSAWMTGNTTGKKEGGIFFASATWGWWNGTADTDPEAGDNDGLCDAYEFWKAGHDYCVKKGFTPQCTNTAVLRSVEFGVGPEQLYMVVDLTGGTNATEFSVNYLANMPEGGWTDEYKTTKLVLRRIEPGTFRMGSPTNEVGREAVETQHRVTLTEPYYIGVFEVTQKQYELVTGGNPSSFRGETRPVDCVSYWTLRGRKAGDGWPTNNAVDEGTFMGIIRTKTGRTFDFPTEAQWEYACRAGTTTALNSGKNLTNPTNCPNMAEVGRYHFNTNDGVGGFNAGHTVVGSYQPNAWGLYDMHGNVTEWCLDRYTNALGSAAVTNPVGAATGYERSSRGGCWFYLARICRSACRRTGYPPDTLYNNGFRLVCLPGEGDVVGTGPDWKYVVTNGAALVTGVEPAEGALTIPSVLGGYPVKGIAEAAFDGCDGLTSLVIPDSVTDIGENAFHDCGGLVSVTMGNGVRNIGVCAFLDCSALSTVTMGNSVTNIGNQAFAGCDSLASVTIPDGVLRIGDGAFEYSGLKTVEIGAGVTNIGDSAFSGCGLTTVTVPDRVTSIGAHAFSFCRLTSVTLGGSLTNIGDGAFLWCTNLPVLSIPDSVTHVGKGAFDGCAELKQLIVPGAWKETSMLADAKVPAGCEIVYREAAEVPQYMVIDLSGGPDAERYDVSTLQDVPAGGWTDDYKTTKLVLRRIEPGTFTMGSPTNELGRRTDVDEEAHEVTLTKPYWIGVFQVTQKQWSLVMGDNPSSQPGETRPVHLVTYDAIRGTAVGTNWPTDGGVDAWSFAGRVRSKTGLALDLPTEAQWEYACRAGTTTALNSGKNLVQGGAGADAGMSQLGRYSYNQQDGKGGYSNGCAAVGSYLPNAWGLYDMHGNVYEWCLDWQEPYGEGAARDPTGPSSGRGRSMRGGAWNSQARYCRSASRSSAIPSVTYNDMGLRLGCAMGAGETFTCQIPRKTVWTNRVALGVMPGAVWGGGSASFGIVSGPGRIDGGVLEFTGPGDVVLSVELEGRTVRQTVTATKAPAKILFENQTQYFDENPKAILVTTEPPGLKVSVTYDGSTNLPSSAGFHDVAVSIEDDLYRGTGKATMVIVAPNRYLVVDISGGADAESWPVEWLEAPPAGGWTDEFKTTKLVLRRIEPGTFTMGSPTNEYMRFTNEIQHAVTLTRPFCMGVFQVTQKQWELAMGPKDSFYRGDMRPEGQVNYDMIRGSEEGTAWPAARAVDSWSFMGVLRAKTGLGFDLPTEAQWEYASRAGTTASLNSGKPWEEQANGTYPNLAEVARFADNREDGRGGYTNMYTTVGCYMANAWGLHDMHGNVWEWCLDWFGDYGTGAVTNPVGPVSGTERVKRGGSASFVASNQRVAFRGHSAPDRSTVWYNAGDGFRICLELDE